MNLYLHKYIIASMKEVHLQKPCYRLGRSDVRLGQCSHLLKKSVRTSGLIVRPATLSNQDTSAFRVIVTPSKTDRWSWFACSAGCVGTAGSSNAPLLEPIVTCGWSASFGQMRYVFCQHFKAFQRIQDMMGLIFNFSCWLLVILPVILLAG